MCKKTEENIQNSIDPYRLRDYAESTGWNVKVDEPTYQIYTTPRDTSAVVRIEDNQKSLWDALETLCYFNNTTYESVLPLVSSGHAMSDS